MKNFINWLPDNYCTECDKESLVLITTKGAKISLDNYNDNKNRQYSHFECTNCGNKYFIDWSDKTPKPIRGTDILNRFLYKFNWITF